MARDSVTASHPAEDQGLIDGKEKSLGRRQFIKRMTLAGALTVAGATALGGGKLALSRIGRARELARRDDARPSEGRWFTPAERRVVESLCDMVVPSDENGPGALQAGVVERLDRMLALSPRSRSLYARGLLAFDELASGERGRLFADLSGTEKIALVEALEKLFQAPPPSGISLLDKVSDRAAAIYRSWPEGAAGDFFAVLVEDALAAFYSSQKAWNFLSYDGPPFSRAYIANFGSCGTIAEPAMRGRLQS
jgi:hypothetical protein